jgi:hypothetical protein
MNLSARTALQQSASDHPVTVVLAMSDELMAAVTNDYSFSSAGQHELYPSWFFPPPLPPLSKMFELVNMMSLQGILTTA